VGDDDCEGDGVQLPRGQDAVELPLCKTFETSKDNQLSGLVDRFKLTAESRCYL
jgi:hypothetical protein